MKENLQVIIFAVLFVVVGIRLYKKYFNKGEGKPGQGKKPGSSFGPVSNDDDYEPYSGK
jgi:hypothetical protein